VLELRDLVDRPVDLDVVAVFELVGGDRGESVLLEPNLDGLAVCGQPYRRVLVGRRSKPPSAEHHRRLVAKPTVVFAIVVAWTLLRLRW
jgi:hypothetical protein